MAVSPFTSVNFAAFEQAISGDLNRLQKLGSRELQNLVAADAFANNIDGAAGQYADVTQQGTIINGARHMPTLVSAALNTMSLGQGECYLNDAAGVGVDDSSYQVARWAAQVVSFTAADGANPRLDLIVAEPIALGTDPQSRNVLFDPTTRTVQVQTINKTVNPTATITVVTGTAAANPGPPAVPAGKIALFEVLVPAGAASSATFQPVRRIWRRAVGPLGVYHGILSGCNLQWSDVGGGGETSADSVLTIELASSNRVVIDGELIQFGVNALSSAGAGLAKGVYQDSSNNPFSVAAPANKDKPYFIYLCGGRHIPGMLVTGSPPAPVVLVESLTAPSLANGTPSAALTIANFRGVNPITIPTAAAVYVGIGFVVQGQIFRKGCVIDGDFVYAKTGSQPTPVFFAGFNEPVRVAASTLQRLFSRPSVSNMADVVGVYSDTAAAPVSFTVDGNVVPSAGRRVFELVTAIANANGRTWQTRRVPLSPFGGTEEFITPALAATGSFSVFASAFNMNVKRLSR